MKVWHKDPLIAAYDVGDLIEELQEWVDEGFVEADIWLTLQKRIHPTLLPEQMEQETVASLRQVKEQRSKKQLYQIDYNIGAFGFFANAKNWQYCHYCSLDIPIYL